MSKKIRTVLIIDDDPDFTALLKNYFKRKKWNIYSLTDSHQAAIIIQKTMPDIVLLDVVMPERDGVTTCRIIRSDLNIRSNVPIIMMTGNHEKEVIMKSIQAGCNDFIIKPFDFSVLQKKIDILLSPKKDKEFPPEQKNGEEHAVLDIQVKKPKSEDGSVKHDNENSPPSQENDNKNVKNGNGTPGGT